MPTYTKASSVVREIITATNLNILKFSSSLGIVIYKSADSKSIYCAKINNSVIDTTNAVEIKNTDLGFADTITLNRCDISEIPNVNGSYNFVIVGNNTSLSLTTLDIADFSISTTNIISLTTFNSTCLVSFNPKFRDYFVCITQNKTGNYELTVTTYIKVYNFNTRQVACSTSYGLGADNYFNRGEAIVRWDNDTGLYLNVANYFVYGNISGTKYASYVYYINDIFSTITRIINVGTSTSACFLSNDKMLFNNKIYQLTNSSYTVLSDDASLSIGLTTKSGFTNNQLYIGGNNLVIYDFNNSTNTIILNKTEISGSTAIIVGNNRDDVYAYRNTIDIYSYTLPSTNIITKLRRINTDFVDTSSADATSGDIASGKTAYVGGNKVIGTMPNNGAITITPSTSSQSIPVGYHNGSGIVEPCAITQEDYEDCEDLVDDIMSNMQSPYTPIEYIQSTGTQYINTDFMPTQNTKVELTVSNIANADRKALFGAHTTYDDNRFMMYIYGGTMWWTYSSKVTVTNDLVSKHTIQVYRGTVIRDGTTISSSTTINSNASNTYLRIFMNPSTNIESKCSYKLYSFKVWDNDILVRDFIPVKDSNNVVCLYDKVSETFFYNQGTGTFTAGNELDSPLKNKLQAIDNDLTTNLLSENIKAGESILGVEGTYTGEISQADIEEAEEQIADLFGEEEEE